MNTKTDDAKMSLEDIRNTLRSEMPRLRQDHGVGSLEIFGSYVRGEASPESDLDLLVEFDITPTLFSFIRLENELSRLLGVKVDLVMKDGLKPALGTQIRAEAIAV
jgi:predicted nucleotidyltransferase